VLYRNDASGNAFRNVFKQQFVAKGGALVYEDAHQPNEADFRSFINKISSIPDMDVLFVASFGPEVATYLKQANELGVKKQVISHTTFYSPKVLEIAGPSANGVLFSAPAFDATSNDPNAADLRNKVLAKYGQKEINYYVASHYDAMMLLLTAISKGNRDGESLRRYLSTLNSYQGKSGEIKFGPNGTCTIPLKIYTVVDGNFVPYQ
jgi:branched-chain amino acid transport system substrate-binding protein